MLPWSRRRAFPFSDVSTRASGQRVSGAGVPDEWSRLASGDRRVLRRARFERSISSSACLLFTDLRQLGHYDTAKFNALSLQVIKSIIFAMINDVLVRKQCLQLPESF